MTVRFYPAGMTPELRLFRWNASIRDFTEKDKAPAGSGPLVAFREPVTERRSHDVVDTKVMPSPGTIRRWFLRTQTSVQRSIVRRGRTFRQRAASAACLRRRPSAAFSRRNGWLWLGGCQGQPGQCRTERGRFGSPEPDLRERPFHCLRVMTARSVQKQQPRVPQVEYEEVCGLEVQLVCDSEEHRD